MAVCLNCGSERVRLGSSIVRHALRSLFGTRKRYCASCHKRWMEDRQAHIPNIIRIPLAFCALILAPLFIVTARTGTQTSTFRSAPLPIGRAAPTMIHSQDRPAPSASSPATKPSSPEDDENPASAEGSEVVDLAANASTDGPIADPRYAAAPAKNASILSSLWNEIADIAKIMSPKSMIDDMLDSILKKDKKTLWNEYGQYFGSKDAAKTAYNQAQQQRANAHP